MPARTRDWSVYGTCYIAGVYVRYWLGQIVSPVTGFIAGWRGIYNEETDRFGFHND